MHIMNTFYDIRDSLKKISETFEKPFSTLWINGNTLANCLGMIYGIY